MVLKTAATKSALVHPAVDDPADVLLAQIAADSARLVQQLVNVFLRGYSHFRILSGYL